MSNSAPPLFLASFFLIFAITCLIGGLLVKFGYCNLDDKSTFPIGTNAPASGISEATPLVNEDL
jgi:hypothetical protein